MINNKHTFYDADEVQVILNELKKDIKFMEFCADPSGDNWDEVREGSCYCIYNGASKGVIVPDFRDFVLKFPFNDTSSDVDYCAVERMNYIRAQEAGVEDCLVATDYFGRLLNVKIYVQERADCDESDISDAVANLACEDYISCNSEDGRTREELEDEFFNDYSDDDPEYMENYMIKEWGYDIAKKFIDFCDDNDINDLHSGNVGFMGDHLVVIDYSGYGLDKDSANSRIADTFRNLKLAKHRKM